MTLRLPSELEEEIISRVTFRILAKWRSVCKLWNSMILDQSLILKNLSRTHIGDSRDHRFIISHDGCLSSVSTEEQVLTPSENLSLGRVHPTRIIKVYKVVHCNGLLLCVMDNKLLVWNPLLKEMCWVKCGSDFHAYDDAYSLGYLSPCDYRILRFRCASNSRNRPPRVEVCQLSSKTWKCVDMISPFDWFLRIPLAILSLRGTPYCIALREDHTAFLQSFDFSKEIFQPIDQLPFRYDERNPIALATYKGDRLSVLEQCHETRTICIWVKYWLLRPWSRLMVVAIPHSPLLHPPSSRISTSFFVDKNCRLVATSVEFNGFVDAVNIYRVIGENKFEKIEEEHIAGTAFSFQCSFVPSFVRLPGFLKQDTKRIRWRRKRFN
ncbi:hypothetical protein CARUB_v10018559mg [Capsella rubella]|uniref:F-box domain-containing protein n=1 Tax=Capsella rubella TaxID=81985 RepID=R0HJ61_9BRAS|nr:putative F-box/LRR-repeat/kelch-repeat protein At1g11620 [Capsella rubella]EOA25245.1 hypothetical protein CARUB_v10018559mg [Capsella rubella]